jgi:hypothetical protein
MTANTLTFREALTDSMRYWEPRRIVYNLALLAVVGIHALLAWRGSVFAFTTDTALVLFLLWVLANVAYCAAYIADIPVQFSGFRPLWLKVRVVVFVVGIAFAAVLAHFFASVMFQAAGPQP